MVGDDAQRLVGNLVERQDAGAHDAHEGKEDGNGAGGDHGSQRNVALRILGLRGVGGQRSRAQQRVGQQGRGGKQALEAVGHPAFSAEEVGPVDLGKATDGEPDEGQQQDGGHEVLRLCHEVNAKEVDKVEQGDHDAGDQFFVAAANQLTEIEREGLSVEVEAHLGQNIDGKEEAAPSFAEEEVALRVGSAQQTDAGAHENGGNTHADDPHGCAEIGDTDGTAGLGDTTSSKDQNTRTDDDAGSNGEQIPETKRSLVIWHMFILRCGSCCRFVRHTETILLVLIPFRFFRNLAVDGPN